MMHGTRGLFSTSLLVAAAAALAAPAAAQSVADFYKGRTIALMMGTGPGGSYDLYGRTIAAHMSRHIPGKPTIIIEHMPGAGGAKAGNYVFSAAAQDGSKLLETHALPLVEKLRPKGVRFKSAEFQWLGAFDAIVQVMTLWHTAPAKTLADLKTARATEVVVGSFNKTHLTYQWAMLLKSTIGATYKVITGYRGGGPLNVAMEKGEISGWTASWANLTATKAHWLRDRKVNLFVQFSLDRQPDMPDVPTLLELAPPDKKDVVEFITAGTPIARAMTVGPRVPADRVAALRKAFADTMKDPAFLADAKKRKLGIHPRSAEETTALVKKIVSASPDLVARVKTAIGSSD